MEMQQLHKMPKLFLIAILLPIINITLSTPTLSDCKCGQGFEAKEGNEGKVECHGIHHMMNKPCNMPEPIKCVCTEDKATGILSDAEGTWCTVKKGGKEVKKWACENKEEWVKYRKDFAEWKKKYLSEKKK